jgi:hypothetical protein
MKMRCSRSHARKLLKNSVPAYNTKKQCHTNAGRVILWALPAGKDIRENTQAAQKAVKEREDKRVPKMKATIYNREMSIEFQQQAEEAVLGSDWDNVPVINDTHSAVVRLPDRHRGRADGTDEAVEDLIKRDADPLA